MAAPWHELEVGEDGDRRWAVARPSPECGCTLDTPCQTLLSFYIDDGAPGGLPSGKYVMRADEFANLQVAPVTAED